MAGPTALLLEDESLARTATAELAQHLGSEILENDFDLRHSIRRGAGFLGRRLEPEMAERLATRLGRAGYRALVIPEKELSPTPRPIKAARLRLDDDGLAYQVTYRWTEPAPWSALVTAHAYALVRELDSETARKRRGRGVSVAGISDLGEHARNVQWNISAYQDRYPSCAVTLVLDLYLRAPTGLKLVRIEHDSFSYEGLPELSAHSVANFIKLLVLVKERVDPALVPARTELMSRPLAELDLYLIDKVEERDNAARWLLQRCVLGDAWGAAPAEDKGADAEEAPSGPGLADLVLPPELSGGGGEEPPAPERG